ncbi:MAG: hypothetical protein PVH19_13220 [Planctomycetia bacterium]|jgi:hypothetical protein
MLTSVRNWNLGARIGVYTLTMLLFGLLLGVVFRFGFDVTSGKDFLLPWLVCFGSGLASLFIVEPFRHPGGSPYGFLLGGAVRTVPPLILVVIVIVTKQPVESWFWIDLLLTYFFMLGIALHLILPVQKSGAEESSKDRCESSEKDEQSTDD